MSVTAKVLFEIREQLEELQNQPTANTVQRELTEIIVRLTHVVTELEARGPEPSAFLHKAEKTLRAPQNRVHAASAVR